MVEMVDCREVYEDVSNISSVVQHEGSVVSIVAQPKTHTAETMLSEGLEVWNALMCLMNDGTETACKSVDTYLYEKAIETLDNGRVRDHILMRACTGSLARLREVIPSERMEEMLCTMELERPDMASIERACRALEVSCMHARANQGYPFALIGYLLWWSGDFESSYSYVKEALERDPSNSLGTLVLRVLQMGVIAPWITGKCVTLHSNSLE